MHKLSIVIVNYNVRHFLEQVLKSVELAVKNLDVEVWVVDNNSVDASMEMVKIKFPWVKTIENDENVGFSKANNQAIVKSNSDYILLLNPDTVLQDDTLEKCLNFMDEHSGVGGLGVRMIDGKGNFLPESKRGLPTPAVAFYKMTGLANLFSGSKKFGRYHMKYLPENETHEIEVLAGAFMMMRSKVLEEVGLLDESFFMYGEDIDLSYRIIKAGYKNVYFPETTIIHYKGESTKKKSVNYVKVFYNAMILFAQKHYSSRMAGWFTFWIRIAIYLRAGLAIAFRGASRFWEPIADFLLIYIGYFGIASYWELYHKFVPHFYPLDYYYFHIPFYAGLVVLSSFLSGAYDKPFLPFRLFRGGLVGTILLFAAYAFFPKEWQFSRAILALGSAWAIGSTLLFRFIMGKMGYSRFSFNPLTQRRVFLVGTKEECDRINNLLINTRIKHTLLGKVNSKNEKGEGYIGGLHQLIELVEIYSANLVIFSSMDVPASTIMKKMSEFSGMSVQVKIAPSTSEFIIGSDSKNEPGELFTMDVQYNIAEKYNRRRKRVFDMMISLILWMFIPFTLLGSVINYRVWNLFKNSLVVLFGGKTWISYHGLKSSELLPKMKPGIITPSANWTDTLFEGDVNFLYAREFEVSKDIYILYEYIKGKQ
ncbi:MAG: glycosyltransferase [Bacteroidia bacterium]